MGPNRKTWRRYFKRARMTTPCLVVLEDLDAMIDNKTRAFFSTSSTIPNNTGVVVLATTNHPASLIRQSSIGPVASIESTIFLFRRERATRIHQQLNRELQSTCVFHRVGAPKVVRETEGFSFAYMKECFSLPWCNGWRLEEAQEG